MVDKLLQFSISRSWLMMFFVLVVAGIGVWNYQRLPIDAVPDITNVQVQINTQALGYSPLEVEQRITYPVEIALAGLPYVESTRSLSRYALSQVTVVFEEGMDIYFVRNLINERLQQAKAQMPDGIEPEMGPVATGLGEIFHYSVHADKDAKQPNGEPYDAMALRTLQDWVIRPQLRLVPGVAEVNTIGGFEKQFHITPVPAQMLAYGVTFDDIVAALQKNNANIGGGYIEKNGEQYLIRIPGQVADIPAIQQIIVTYKVGVPMSILVKNCAQALQRRMAKKLYWERQ
jgi:cobalt-zinc-cadmium resistance protein CzcA